MPFDAVEAVSFLTFPDLLKAHPAEESGSRYVYLEASNQARDYQGEVVLAKALAASADYYRQFGNLDIDHITQIGARAGIPNFAAFEVGRPVQVNVVGGRTFVKGIIYSGDTPMAKTANDFWDTLTKVNPPQRWYPSVGGSVEEREKRDGEVHITKVRWTNIGFSKTPVNLHVPQVSTIPMAALAKSLLPGGTINLTKALEAGYGTDSATLTGGAALRTQSLDPVVQDYWDFRNRLARAISERRVSADLSEMVRHARTEFALPPHRAVQWTERFLADLKAGASPKNRSNS